MHTYEHQRDGWWHTLLAQWLSWSREQSELVRVCSGVMLCRSRAIYHSFRTAPCVFWGEAFDGRFLTPLELHHALRNLHFTDHF